MTIIRDKMADNNLQITGNRAIDWVMEPSVSFISLKQGPQE